MDQSALHEFESPSSPLYGFRPYDVPAAAPHGSTMVNDQASDPDTTAQANTTERRNVRNVEERSTANGVDISENDTQPLQARVPFALEEKSPPYRPLIPQQHPDLPGRIPVPGATVERSHGPRATPAAQQRTLQAGYDQRRAERLASEHKRHGMGASQ